MNNSTQLGQSLFLIANIFFGLTLATHAQTGTIKGRVISADNNQPMIGVNAGLKGTPLGSATDKEGYFTIHDVPAGTQTIALSSIGYKRLERTVTVSAGKTKSLTFVMKRTITALDGLVVKGLSKSQKLELTAQAVESVELSDTKLKTADLGATMAQTKGVSVRKSGGLGSKTRFSLNGLTDDQVRFFLDGVPLDFSSYAFGISNIPTSLVKRVDIYKGVVPIRFGADALGGVVNLVTANNYTKTDGSVSYQTGSFGTHRAAIQLGHQIKDTDMYISVDGFFDYVKNNYDVDVEIPNENGKLQEATVPRFHDTYQAYGASLELGLKDKSWADHFSVKGHLSDYQKDIQHNNVMSIPYGQITNGKTTRGISVQYDKKYQNSLSLDFSGGYSYDISTFVDTSSYIYNWYGNPVKNSNGEIRKRGSPGELDKASDRELWNNNYYSRLNIGYKLTDQGKFQLTAAPTYVRQKGDEKWKENIQTIDPLNDQKTVFSWISGLKYSWSSPNDNIKNNLFVKGYLQNIQAKEQTNGAPINRNRHFRTMGIGNSLRYAINDYWMIKASYEWATRLPKTNELFGNGSLVRPNLSLKPEKSHNANLTINYASQTTASVNWEVNLNGFLRSTDRLIVLLSDNEIFRYQNVFSALSTGLEASGYLETANSRFRIEGNTTWQSFRNQSSKGEFGQFKGDRIPNRPYFFANLMLQYSLPSVFNNADRLKLFLGNRYVHEFYRGWESVGLKQYKDIIPSQLTQNAGFTYQLPFASQQTSITGEVQNLTNAKVYDFYGVQKPGRAFYIKITTQF